MSIESRKFVAAAILFGLALIAAGLLMAPPSDARAAAVAGPDAASTRIADAFADLPQRVPAPSLQAAAMRLGKGDLGSGCDTAAWPNVASSCLVTADGRPAHPVRTITIGYQADATTTVLLRLPAGEVAQR
jgi:hypothetical protein